MWQPARRSIWSSPPAGFTPTPNACQQGQTVPGRNAYVNIGTVTIPEHIRHRSPPATAIRRRRSVSPRRPSPPSRAPTRGRSPERLAGRRQSLRGQNANVGYTVQVTRSAPVDSGWQVSGVISVTNTGASAVQLNSVADSISGVGAVTVQCPAALPTSLARV